VADQPRVLLLDVVLRPPEPAARELLRDGQLDVVARAVGRVGADATRRRLQRHGRVGAVVGRVVLVAVVELAATPPDEDPADAAPEALHHVPGIEGVDDGEDAEGAALVRADGVDVGAGAGVGDEVPGHVGFVGVGEEVHDGEEGHLDADEKGGDADVEVGEGEVGGRGEDVEGGGGEDGDDEGLPEGEEDDEFDGEDFEEGVVRGEVVADLDVELDQEVHGDCYGCGVDH